MSRTFPSDDVIRKSCADRKNGTVYKQPKTKQELTALVALKELHRELSSYLPPSSLSLIRTRLLPTNREEDTLSCYRTLSNLTTRLKEQKEW
jgi:hypothetical protein